MKVKRTETGFIVVLDRGDEVISSLKKLAFAERIAIASFTGIGAVKDAVLGYLDLDQRDYLKREFAESMEVVSLTGNIATGEGQAFIHCHAALGDSRMQLFGGHLFQATVSVTVEIFLRVYEGEMTRRFDENSGANLISF